jgi:hypothetical protein
LINYKSNDFSRAEWDSVSAYPDLERRPAVYLERHWSVHAESLRIHNSWPREKSAAKFEGNRETALYFGCSTQKDQRNDSDWGFENEASDLFEILDVLQDYCSAVISNRIQRHIIWQIANLKILIGWPMEAERAAVCCTEIDHWLAIWHKQSTAFCLNPFRIMVKLDIPSIRMHIKSKLLRSPYRRLSQRRLITTFGAWVRFLHKEQENPDEIHRVSWKQEFDRIIIVWLNDLIALSFFHAWSRVDIDDSEFPWMTMSWRSRIV